jgi:hypothetical protein
MPSLEELVKKVNAMWDQWRPLPPDIEASLAETNNIDKLRKTLAEKGVLLCFCHDCRVATTIAALKGVLEVY